jgi:hypothetical protein
MLPQCFHAAAAGWLQQWDFSGMQAGVRWALCLQDVEQGAQLQPALRV